MLLIFFFAVLTFDKKTSFFLLFFLQLNKQFINKFKRGIVCKNHFLFIFLSLFIVKFVFICYLLLFFCIDENHLIVWFILCLFFSAFYFVFDKSKQNNFVILAIIYMERKIIKENFINTSQVFFIHFFVNYHKKNFTLSKTILIISR